MYYNGLDNGWPDHARLRYFHAWQHFTSFMTNSEKLAKFKHVQQCVNECFLLDLKGVFNNTIYWQLTFDDNFAWWVCTRKCNCAFSSKSKFTAKISNSENCIHWHCTLTLLYNGYLSVGWSMLSTEICSKIKWHSAGKGLLSLLLYMKSNATAPFLLLSLTLIMEIGI